MNELLERWAEMEPDGIKHCGLDDWDHLWGVIALLPELDCLDNAIVEKATQQAIEARDGWTWSLMKDTAGTYKGRVWISDVVYHHVNSNTSPAEALLSAYLSALEAVKTQEVVG